MESKSSRGKSRGSGKTASVDDWRKLVSAGTLLFVVLAILLLGGILESDPTINASPGTPSPAVRIEERFPGPADPATEPPSLPSSALPPERQPVPEANVVPDRIDDLAARVERDTARIGRDLDGWTLQLLVACDPENAGKRLADAGGAEDLYLLPLTLDGRSCFRVCWGRYDSRQSALAARDIPVALRTSLDEDPRPRPVADVIP